VIEESFQDRVNKQMRREIEEAETDWVRQQKLLDHLWQQKLDAETDCDGYDESGGFRERRTKYGFHKHWRDGDWRVR
jgi:hypothetical protein